MLHLGSDPSSSQPQPSTSKEITVHFTMRRALVPALVVVALVAISIGR
jgi:hypothetical protein